MTLYFQKQQLVLTSRVVNGYRDSRFAAKAREELTLQAVILPVRQGLSPTMIWEICLWAEKLHIFL